MRGGWLFAALLLSACGVPRSEAPLIATSESPAELKSGLYAVMVGNSPAELAELSAEARSKCIDFGYSETDNDVRRQMVHCPGESDARIDAVAGGYSLSGRGDEEGGFARFDFRVRRLPGTDFYIVQANEIPPQGYYYPLLRFRDGRAELFTVPCHDPDMPRRVGVPPLKFKCALTTLAAAEPEFRAEIGRIERGEARFAPAIFRRIGD